MKSSGKKEKGSFSCECTPKRNLCLQTDWLTIISVLLRDWNIAGPEANYLIYLGLSSEQPGTTSFLPLPLSTTCLTPCDSR